MQLYVADYLGDTRHLTTEQHGAYLLLLMTMWRSDGRLPNDAKKLARITGCTASRWAKISDDVLAFFEADGDDLTNRRLMFELKKASEKSIKRAEAGTKGGEAKALKNNKADVANATALSKHSSEPDSEPEDKGAVVERASDDDWPEGKAIDHAALLVLEAATVFLDPSRQMLLVTTTGRLDAWRKAGASWEHDVVPVVTALARKARSPIASWKFFDAAIAKSIADNAAALEIPAVSPRNDPQRPDRHTAQLGHLHRVFAAMGDVDDRPVERGREDRGHSGDEGRLRSLPPAA